ncbi:tail-collar fiber protein [Hydrogenoanaerobacterium saccharovorans]|uniref:Phage tail-collar fibre protein n=1 Tax=Hydrogenoanaerobacterium saccharovorans TaxID=474960 RepID=A0A1H7ZZ45_9FIRM|nr:phage tail protein [Hydrogenoanaerobacterium saccharovorans]RPF48270.1 tail-collar fiber protein [Hydrogenoanaerobacterium saccharovorans]SEM63725.1 Phage tail-collar fibre protein [Hydrogenoanaerobacterium saccharovorans]
MAETQKTYGTLVTDVGVQLITAATMQGAKVNITHLAVGDGNGAYYQPLPSMTKLKNEKWRGAVNSVLVSEQSPNMIDIVAVVPSSVGGWTIREMAVFDEAENMIAICNTPDTEKVIITTGAAGEIELTMHLEISNTGAISFVIDPNVITARKKDIDDHNSSPSAHQTLFAKKADVIELNTHVNNPEIHVSRALIENYDIVMTELIGHAENQILHTTQQQKSEWTTGAQAAAQAMKDAVNALNKCAELECRVTRAEDGIFSNITGNPFLVSFDSFDGVTLVKGIWNSARQRIEC